jgi:formylglycine-generating enzyme required for sulfatase activity
VIAISGCAALGVVLLLALKMRPAKDPLEPGKNLPDALWIAAGKHPTPDGTIEDLHAFRITAHEVTIGEYAAFLEILETLAKDQRERIFDHESQPAEKTGHLPDDWPNLLAAAKTRGVWGQRPVTLDSPVVGVDWWDAAAYAEWKKARIPTQEEWFAALSEKVSVPGAIPASNWQPVTAPTTDRTPTGLLGMAGSVAEWTRRQAANPANPLGERKWVIIGGSFLKPGSNALTREWVEDRSLRRPDLGFRIVMEP